MLKKGNKLKFHGIYLINTLITCMETKMKKVTLYCRKLSPLRNFDVKIKYMLRDDKICFLVPEGNLCVERFE